MKLSFAVSRECQTRYYKKKKQKKRTIGITDSCTMKWQWEMKKIIVVVGFSLLLSTPHQNNLMRISGKVIVYREKKKLRTFFFVRDLEFFFYSRSHNLQWTSSRSLHYLSPTMYCDKNKTEIDLNDVAYCVDETNWSAFYVFFFFFNKFTYARINDHRSIWK